MVETVPTTPNFEVEKIAEGRYCLWLHCSKCGVRIKEVFPSEVIKVNRAYYCKPCDDGTIHMNPPVIKKGP